MLPLCEHRLCFTNKVYSLFNKFYVRKFFPLTRSNFVSEEVFKYCCLTLGNILKEFYAKSPGY